MSATSGYDNSTDSVVAIGGYLELELNEGPEYHPDAMKLNTGRNAFEFILQGRSYRKVFLPYYTCDVMLHVIERLGINHQFYHIDTNLEPCFDFADVQEDEGFVYTNYFGVKDRYVKSMAGGCRNLIVDNAQSFFSKPVPDADVFYSPRKFFGLPDGAYLYTDLSFDQSLECDHSGARFAHLLDRIEYGPERGYASFRNNSAELLEVPVRRMSHLTQRLLRNIDYAQVSAKRRTNFSTLHDGLGSLNELKFGLMDADVPMAYPFYTHVRALRQRLIENRVFVAKYWPNVVRWTKPGDLERDYAENIVPLPVDQRYCPSDMKRILSLIWDMV